MKKVFPTTSECIHTYAQFSQPEGKAGNVFFYGNTLYSYGYHFPLAHKCENDKGETVILLNGSRYSVSTSDHQNHVQAATRQYRQIISFGLGRYDQHSEHCHSENRRHYIMEYLTIAEKLAVARKPVMYIEQAESLHAQAMEYFNFFGYDPGAEYQKAYKGAIEVSEEVKAKVKAQQAEIREAKKAMAIEQAKTQAIRIEEWIRGERSDIFPRPAIDLLRIRTKPGGAVIVETSQGVEMTTQEAKAIYLQLIRQELKPGVKVLENYTVISVNGVVKIGCHTFETDYLINFGKTL